MQGRTGKIDKKYAKTLFSLSNSENYQFRLAGLDEWLLLLDEVPQLEQTLQNPVMPLDDRLSIAREAAERCRSGDEIFKNFICELVQNRRIEQVEAIRSIFARMVEEAQGRLSVEVVSAFTLPDDERQRLASELEGRLKKVLKIDWIVDREIIGGLIIRTGGAVLDNSLRGALERARRQLRV